MLKHVETLIFAAEPHLFSYGETPRRLTDRQSRSASKVVL